MDNDDRDEAFDTSITVLSALPVVGAQVSAAAKLIWQAWGRRTGRCLDANVQLLTREWAQREGRQLDDEAWFRERLRDYKVESAIEKSFDKLLRARDASARLSIARLSIARLSIARLSIARLSIARLSIARLYAAYVGGDALSRSTFLQYGDFLSAAGKHVIRGAQAITES